MVSIRLTQTKYLQHNLHYTDQQNKFNYVNKSK